MRFVKYLEEKKWSSKVDADFHPKEGIFTKSAEEIVNYLVKKHKNLKKVMSEVNFYVNRAGKNLSSDDRSKFDRVKELVQKKLGSEVNEDDSYWTDKKLQYERLESTKRSLQRALKATTDDERKKVLRDKIKNINNSLAKLKK